MPMLLLEEQRYGRDKTTLVNHTYINGGEYKRKFDLISNNKKLSRLLYQLAKKMLEHRSGTKYEDMYWIDLETLEIVAEETNSLLEKTIRYSEKTKAEIKKHRRLLTIHTHPDSYPPSIEDFNANYENQYEQGIVLCHNGKVYRYLSKERINAKYVKMLIEEYSKNGYNEDEAQIEALNELSEKHDIFYEEVVGNDRFYD